jgi:hypothetical protein
MGVGLISEDIPSQPNDCESVVTGAPNKNFRLYRARIPWVGVSRYGL